MILKRGFGFAIALAAIWALPMVFSPATAMDWPVVEDAGKAAKPAAAGSTAEPTTPDAPAVAAKPEPPPPPPVTLKVSINLSTQTITVSEDGQTRHTWKISSGRRGYPTPTGTYKPYRMHKMWHSRKYDWAPMPNAVFFHKGFAVHGTYATRALGRPASHGCIRLAPSNAKKLYDLVRRHGMASTRVTLYGSPKFSPPQIAKRRYNPRRIQRVPRGYAYRYGQPPRRVYPRTRYRRSPYARVYPGDPYY